MAAIVVGIKVTVEKRSNSNSPYEECPIVFSYSGNNSSGNDILDTTKRDLYFTLIQEKVTLVFYLAPTTLEWNEKKYDVSLKSASDPNARKALWIWKAVGGVEGPYPEDPNSAKNEFRDFSHGTDSNGRATTMVTSRNRALEDYYFKLAVYLTNSEEKEIECRDDPQIKNGGLNGTVLGFPKQTVINTVIGIIALVSIVLSFLRFGIRFGN